MDFIESTLETSPEGLEIVSGLLYQLGLTGLMIEDERDFQEFMKNPDRQWDYIEDSLVEEKKKTGVRIIFYVTDNASGMEQLSGIHGALKNLKDSEKEFDLGSLRLRSKNVKEEDWANNWKKYFKPFAIGEKMVIKPSWEILEGYEGKTVLEIDPGHIFGTGSHETTQLCIELIEGYIKPADRVLDIGCGSGILSIASLLFGAKNATAIDIDPNAIEIAYENAERNGIKRETYEVLAGNILEDDQLEQKFVGQAYDMVEANIMADIIVLLSAKVPNYIKDGGVFITSGIITERLEEVKQALTANGFEVEQVLIKKDWAGIASICHKK